MIEFEYKKEGHDIIVTGTLGDKTLKTIAFIEEGPTRVMRAEALLTKILQKVTA